MTVKVVKIHAFCSVAPVLFYISSIANESARIVPWATHFGSQLVPVSKSKPSSNPLWTHFLLKISLVPVPSLCLTRRDSVIPGIRKQANRLRHNV